MFAEDDLKSRTGQGRTPLVKHKCACRSCMTTRGVGAVLWEMNNDALLFANEQD